MLTLSVLPDLPPALKAYFENEVQPTMHANMLADSACESINHVLKQRVQ